MNGKGLSRWWWVGALALVGLGLIAVRAARGPAAKPLPTIIEPTVTINYDRTGRQASLKIEDYLVGVVAAEVPGDWPVEAVRAQAIVARTYTMKRLAEGGVKSLHGTDVCDNPDHFQAYDASRTNETVRRAVADTRGQVITYRGNYILAWFHANSGGRTATPQEGLDWKGEATPYLTNVKDVAGSEGFSPWTASFTKADIRSAVIRVTGTDPGSFTSIGITKRGPSGRAMALVMGGAAVSGPQLRIALGSEKLKSTLIDQISVLGENVTFSGRGFGHGVGMAQDGARALATQGRKAADIVRFYYRSVQVVTRWR